MGTFEKTKEKIFTHKILTVSVYGIDTLYYLEVSNLLLFGEFKVSIMA